MKKLSKIFALLLTAAMVLSLLAACGPSINIDGDPTNTPGGGTQTQDPNGGEENPTNKTVHDMYASGTTLNMATGYNNIKTGIAFDASIIETYGTDGILTLSNGKNYREGDLKPTWVEAGERLGITFVSKWKGEGSASKEFEFWDRDGLGQVDMVSGSASGLAEAGAAGKLVNIAEYLDLMPNFKAYLDANPIVKLSLVGDTATGAIYYSPYFDGVNDIERMPLMRTDWVEKLLNGEGEFTGTGKAVTTGIYTPYMPTSGTVSVDVVKADGSGTEKVTKDYGAYGNIIEVMNSAGSIDGVQAVNMLREYIDKTYNGYYGENRADLYIGQNAAWDADELVALLRCVVANPQTLNGGSTVFGLFSREDKNNQRKVDVFRFAGTLFGVRGLESRQDYLYVGNDGLLHDARQEADTYAAMERMNAMVKEGLISESFVKDQDENTAKMLQEDMGFMHYDYSQTQTIYNEQGILDAAAGEIYRPVMVPVARWNDGTGEQFFRFTESWRSVKTDGWAITKDGGGADDNKLYAALSLIDYAYTTEGQILMSYGPDEFIKTDASGNYVYFDFNGEKWPEIADSTREELWTIDAPKGNYTNYARYFLGSTLSFLKSQAFEYQCTAEAGRLGAGYISKAIGLGVIKHPELDVNGAGGNQWYTIVPTTLPTDKQQNDLIATYTELSSKGVFSQSTGDSNLLIDIIINGYSNSAPASSAQGVADHVAGTWNGSAYLTIKNAAWADAQDYYKNN